MKRATEYCQVVKVITSSLVDKTLNWGVQLKMLVSAARSAHVHTSLASSLPPSPPEEPDLSDAACVREQRLLTRAKPSQFLFTSFQGQQKMNTAQGLV